MVQGGGAGLAGATTGSTPAAGEDGSCACRAAGPGNSAARGWGLTALGALLLRSRRRPRAMT